MNYQFGFYRRALVGSFFMLIHNQNILLIAMILAYSICLISPLLIIKGVLKIKNELLVLLFMIVVFLSPYGISFYIKDTEGIRKESFFFPLFYSLVLCKNTNLFIKNILITAFIIIASLIQESFFFLFLPFLLCYLWLDEWIDKKWLALHLVIGIGVTLLSVVQGNSAMITDNFIQQYIDIGFEKQLFRGFTYYQKLPFSEFIIDAFHHFTGINPFIYFSLYIGNFFFIAFLATYFNIVFSFKKTKLLLASLGIILLMVLILCFIAMDYGRWFAIAFIVSAILIAIQIEDINYNPVSRPVIFSVAICIISIGFIVLLRIPHWTPVRFNTGQWFWGTRSQGTNLGTFRMTASYIPTDCKSKAMSEQTSAAGVSLKTA